MARETGSADRQRDSGFAVSIDGGEPLRLEHLRETIERVLRTAERLFDGAAADVVLAEGGRSWRARTGRAGCEPRLARRLAEADDPIWIEDLRNEPGLGELAGFCAASPIRLQCGTRIGALCVRGAQPRPRAPQLTEALGDLRALLSDGCDVLLGGDLRRVRELFEAAPGFMCIARGPDHVIDLANEAFHRYIGGHRDVLGRPAAEALPELVDQGFIALLDEVYRTGRAHGARGACVRLLRGPSGAPPEEAYVDFVYQPMREPDGTVSGIFCQGYEVTEIRAAELALEATQRQLKSSNRATRAILDQLRDVVCTLDQERRFLEVNRQSEAIWGEPPARMIGRSHLDFVHPDDRKAAQEVLEDIRAGTPTTSFVARALRSDGEAVPVTWSSAWSEEHRRFFAVGRDLRERLRLEQQQRQARKMEAVGRLTGGIAHDFNNLLTTIMGSAELLVQALAADEPNRVLAELIADACDRGADLVGSLLAFSRRQALRPATLSCSEVLKSLSSIVRSSLPETIAIEVEPPPAELWCLADRTGLTTALLNLCINARDAMPTGGVLQVRAWAGAPADGQEGQVLFEVRDSGCGMPQEVLERALEPFFTTKPAGKGTGLGLSMVHGFATQSGGRLEIRSEPGAGTAVRIALPAAPASRPDPEAERPTPMAIAPRRILVVEDDDLVREQLNRQLIALGYQAVLAANGPEALARLAEAPVDLLITDVVMPGGMNGRQVADHARLLQPGLPLIFTSGYLDDVILREARLEKGMRLLRKPYRRHELASLVQAALGDA